MTDSTETAATYAMPAEDFRRLLTGQIRTEVTETVWHRLRSTFTLGGLVSVSVVVAAVGLAATWVNGTIRTEVSKQIDDVKRRQEDQLRADRTALEQAVAAERTRLEQLVVTRADAAAREAVRADIYGVEEVRKRVAERLPQQIAAALGTTELRDVIRGETSRLMQDARFWRETTRIVMQAQAGDTTLPPGARFFAFTDLLRDAESAALARAILADSAQRVPDRGLLSEADEARFLRQALGGYAGYLARNAQPNAFPDHQALLTRLGQLVDSDASGFELLVQQFDEPRAIAWLVALARQSAGPLRAAAMGALAGHPSIEARERVDGLICSDATMRAELLANVAARTTRMEADAAARRFATVVGCAKEEILARRIAPLAEACLPDRSLLAIWQLAALPQRRNPAQRRLAADLRARLDALGEACRWDARLPDGEAVRWTVLSPRAATDRGDRAAPGFDALLPMPMDGADPAWLTALADGSGEAGRWLADPIGNLAYLALLQDRLATLSAGSPAVAAAQRRIALALVAAPVVPGRPAERLLLDMLGGAGRPLCEAAHDAFAATPARLVAMPAAAAETIACLRRDTDDEAGWAPQLVRMASLAVTAQPGDGQRQRALLAALANAAGLGDTTPLVATTAVGGVARWLAMLGTGAVPNEAQAPLFPILAQVELDAVLDVIERDEEIAPRIEEATLSMAPADRAPILALLPYLDPGFAAGVPAAPAPAREAAGRSWSRLVVAAPERILADPARGAVLLRTGDDPGRVRLRPIGDGAESPTLEPGTYLIGTRPGAVPRRGPLPTAIQGGPRPESATTIRPDVTYETQLRQSVFFDVPMTTGRPVMIETFGLTRQLDTVIALFGPAGRRLVEDDDGGSDPLSSRICFTPAEDGAHRLQIRHFDGTLDPPGAFEFRVSTVGSCAARR